MRQAPITILCDVVDDWWHRAQYRSPQDPEIQKRLEQAALESRQKSKKYSDRLRERFKQKRIMQD